MNIKNPNEAVAFLNSLDYAIEINDLEFTKRKIDIPLQINPGETQTMPIHMSTDLKQLMNRYSQEKVSEVINSFFGISAEKPKLKLICGQKFSSENAHKIARCHSGHLYVRR